MAKQTSYSLPTMIKFRLFEDITNASFPCGTRFHFQRDIDYIGESQILGTIATLCGGNMQAERITVAKRVNAEPSSILILRAGGAGDILFLTPMLAALRARFPKAHIGVGISERYHWVLRGNKNIDGYSNMPMKLGLVNRYDWVIDLENSAESDNTRHITDVFATYANVSLEDHRLTYHPELCPADFGVEYLKTKKRVGLQLASTSAVRTYPRMLELYKLLQENGWEVAILAEPGKLTLRSPLPDLINLSDKRWSWSKATDFMQTCDFIIGPDSSAIHFAGAMGIPGIGLYGSFLAKYRLIEGGSIQAIQATAECSKAPCFHHMRRAETLPYDGPCHTSRMCNVMATISPQSILEKMNSMGF